MRLDADKLVMAVLPPRILFDVCMEGENERTPKTKLAIVLEDGEAAQFVIGCVACAPNCADGFQGGQETEKKVGGGIIETVVNRERQRWAMDSECVGLISGEWTNSSISVSSGNRCSWWKTSILTL